MSRTLLLLSMMVLALLLACGMALVDSPTTKEDCKNGGYAKYGFKNQGQCITAVVVEPPHSADTTAPETTVDSLDTSNVATDGSVVAHFSSNEPGGTFECKLQPMNELGEEINQPPFEPCTSPKTYNDLGWFSYRFYVQAADAAGNVRDSGDTGV